jgi:hypothetical protein
MARDRSHRRMTRALLVQPWREKLTRELPFGMAMECWATQDGWAMADKQGFDVGGLGTNDRDAS